MRVPATLLAALIALQPGASAFAQGAAAAASGSRAAAVPVVLSVPVAPVLGAGPIVSAGALPSALPAALIPVSRLASAAALAPGIAGESRPPSPGLAAMLPVHAAVVPGQSLAGAAGRIERRLQDAARLGALHHDSAPEVGGASHPRLAAFVEHLTHPKAGRALRPPDDGLPPDERDKQERERAKALIKVVGIGILFAAIETIGSWLTGSVALQADAIHLALDTSVSAAALFGLWLSRRYKGADGKPRYPRAEAVIGLLSALAIGLTAVEIGREVFDRFMNPVAVPGPATMVLALAGLAANVINALILRKFRDDGLGMKGAFLHALTDAVGSIGIIASGLAVYYLGWAWADPAIGAVIVTLIMATATNLARASWKALRAPTARPL
ncbi:MAG: cation transporter [Elusimicrobia bacterium]|nr:cation transporter [Elusimicrobiota bacterium]